LSAYRLYFHQQQQFCKAHATRAEILDKINTPDFIRRTAQCTLPRVCCSCPKRRYFRQMFKK